MGHIKSFSTSRRISPALSTRDNQRSERVMVRRSLSVPGSCEDGLKGRRIANGGTRRNEGLRGGKVVARNCEGVDRESRSACGWALAYSLPGPLGAVSLSLVSTTTHHDALRCLKSSGKDTVPFDLRSKLRWLDSVHTFCQIANVSLLLDSFLCFGQRSRKCKVLRCLWDCLRKICWGFRGIFCTAWHSCLCEILGVCCRTWMHFKRLMLEKLYLNKVLGVLKQKWFSFELVHYSVTT